METMLTVVELMEQARKLGVRIAPRTFWKYAALGLVPTGRKIYGRGNVLYFPDDTPKRLYVIQVLASQAGIQPSTLSKQKLGEWEPCRSNLAELHPLQFLAETFWRLAELRGWPALDAKKWLTRKLMRQEITQFQDGMSDLLGRLAEGVGKGGKRTDPQGDI